MLYFIISALKGHFDLQYNFQGIPFLQQQALDFYFSPTHEAKCSQSSEFNYFLGFIKITLTNMISTEMSFLNLSRNVF